MDTVRWGQRNEGSMSENVINLQVHIAHDSEAGVWYVAKSDIPGLSLEAPTATKLVDRIVIAAPELVELNKGLVIDHVEAHVNEPRLVDALQSGAKRTRVSVTPIFDSPLELADA